MAKEDALFNDLPLQMTRAAWHGKEWVAQVGKLVGLKPMDVIPYGRISSF